MITYFQALRDQLASDSLEDVDVPPLQVRWYQCCGSVTFKSGSGSADSCHLLMDPDPAIFVIDLQYAKKMFCLLQRKKVIKIKEVKKQ
jgi:hypothetical protein